MRRMVAIVLSVSCSLGLFLFWAACATLRREAINAMHCTLPTVEAIAAQCSDAENVSGCIQAMSAQTAIVFARCEWDAHADGRCNKESCPLESR